MSYLFPLAVLINAVSMTVLLIELSFTGQPALAADVGIVQGVTVALFYAFSANARSLVLNPAARVSVGNLLVGRLILLVPLSVVAWYLSVYLAHVAWSLALALILRRGVEWIGELHLSEMELRGHRKLAAQYLVLQIFLLLLLLGWTFSGTSLPMPGLFLWGLLPLLMSLGFIRHHLTAGSRLEAAWLQMLPHLGSSAVIGITVYVFRLLILLIVGKTVAGDLYAAFAIGGLLGSMFAQAIGPTILLHEVRGSATGFPTWLRVAVGLSLLSGAALFVMATVRPDQLVWTGKSGFFWMAAGLSLIGGAIMVTAQRVRLRLLQHHADKDVFGPDVLVNILVVGSVPYLFNLVGTEALASLYLISSVVALIFYYSADKCADLWAKKILSWDEPMRSMIALLLLVPIFFQLGGAIFRDPSYYFDTGRLLTRLPVPLSVLACYGGIVLLGGYAWARLTLTTIFLTFTLMLMSSVILTHEQSGQEQAKLILLIQFLLPMFALVLGQLFGVKDGAKSVLGKMFLYALAVLVPAQLAATWLRVQVVLSPYLYLFSVYQHLQYVPLMFVTAYLVALFSLWEESRYRMALLSLGATMGIYVAASTSNLAIGLLIAGVLGFTAYEKRRGRIARGVLVLCVLVLVSFSSYFWIATSKSVIFHEKLRGVPVGGMEATAPQNITQRIAYWKFYTGEVLDSVKTAALGHAKPPDRTQYPSAHNYYLDFAYNFGLIALLPLLWLIALTLIGVYRNWGVISASLPLLGLAAIVFFLILVDNSLKVGMRQPYPGILTFFLWGVLLTKLGPKSVSTDSSSSP